MNAYQIKHQTKAGLNCSQVFQRIKKSPGELPDPIQTLPPLTGFQCSTSCFLALPHIPPFWKVAISVRVFLVAVNPWSKHSINWFPVCLGNFITLTSVTFDWPACRLWQVERVGMPKVSGPTLTSMCILTVINKIRRSAPY